MGAVNFLLGTMLALQSALNDVWAYVIVLSRHCCDDLRLLDWNAQKLDMTPIRILCRDEYKTRGCQLFEFAP